MLIGSSSGIISADISAFVPLPLSGITSSRDGDGMDTVTSIVPSLSSLIFTVLSLFVSTNFKGFLAITSSSSSRGPTSEDADVDTFTLISNGIPFVSFLGFSFDSFSGEETSLLFALMIKSSISSISARMFRLLRKPFSSSGALSVLFDLSLFNIDSAFLPMRMSLETFAIDEGEVISFGGVIALVFLRGFSNAGVCPFNLSRVLSMDDMFGEVIGFSSKGASVFFIKDIFFLGETSSSFELTV
mmetsp:Transcript_16210/g.24484  ORF Transcript_16210/g.24484 Transcript_16210/m.24484 type:complete len:244 (-) Transcript_16210:351-1082(-)